MPYKMVRNFSDDNKANIFGAKSLDDDGSFSEFLTHVWKLMHRDLDIFAQLRCCAFSHASINLRNQILFDELLYTCLFDRVLLR